MYIVSKGKEKVNTPDKESAKTILLALNELDVCQPMAIRTIEGLDQNSDIYTLEFAGYTTDVLGKDSVLMLSMWVLLLNCTSISITKKEG